MYQVHFNHGSEEELRQFASGLSTRIAQSPDARTLVHVFNDTANRSVTDKATSILRSELPNALFAGCSTSGTICDGAFVASEQPNVSAIVNVFEDPRTIIEVHQFPLNRETKSETAAAIRELINERPWVKAVEMLTTLIDVGMADFCDEARLLPENVIVFGGGALTSETINMWKGLPYVFSSAGENSGEGIVLVLYGGESFHLQTLTIYGWKPLGRHMEITRAEGPVLYELDGAPAYERYCHYLSLEDNDVFATDSVLFPLAIDHEDRTVIKALVDIGENGSITLSSDLASYHKQCRIAYGDPGTILRSIREGVYALREFEPQGIMAYSCAARRKYWGDEHISRETLPLQAIAPTAGFYTGGEFCREGGELLHHNVTLVVASIREGDATGEPKGEVAIDAMEFTRQMEIVNSLAAFVGVTSAELEDAYARLEVAARTDELTGLLNRGVIESRIEEALAERAADRDDEPPALVMLDIDNFKAVNDTFGHRAGDEVLRKFGELLRTLADDAGADAPGRWGGEEFMVLLPSASLSDACAFAERARGEFAGLHFPISGSHTISIGVAQAMPGETSDMLSQRVDKALYSAKEKGKNRVETA